MPGPRLFNEYEAREMCPPGSKEIYILDGLPSMPGKPTPHHVLLCEGLLQSPSDDRPSKAIFPRIQDQQEKSLLKSGVHIGKVADRSLAVALLLKMTRHTPFNAGKRPCSFTALISAKPHTNVASLPAVLDDTELERGWWSCIGLEMKLAIKKPASYIYYGLGTLALHT
jgi:hypothetical protein